MKRTLLLHILFVMVNFSAFSQEDNSIIFTKSIGFTNSNEFPYAMTELVDSTIVITGSTDRTRSNSIFVLEVNHNNGDTLKTNSFGAVNADDNTNDIIPSDDGYIITGETSTYNKNKSEEDAFIMEFDRNLKWKYYPKNYGSEDFESGKKILEHDGCFFIGINQRVEDPQTGDKEYFSYLIKTDKKGNLIWTKEFRSVGQSWFGDCIADKDGNVIVLLTIKDNLSGGRQIYFVKISNEGEIINQNKLQTSFTNGSVSVSSITFINDTTLVVTGAYSISWNEQYPLYLQTNLEGELKIEKIFDFGKKASGKAIIPLENNKCLICGEKGSDGFCLYVNDSGDHEDVYFYDYMINDALIHKNGDLYTLGDALINYPSNTFRNIYLSRTKLK